MLIMFSCRLKQGTPNLRNTEDEFQSIIDSVYNLYPETIGIMVHIESPARSISWSGGVGFSSKERNKPLEPNQPAHIASSIKTYVSASILRIQEEKNLSIDDPIKDYLPQRINELLTLDGYNTDSIKILHLLSHKSGIDSYGDQSFFTFVKENPKYRWTRYEQIKRTVDVGSPIGGPQEKFRYSDANYLLCAEIIEKITGEPLHQAIMRLLKFEELGLYQTWFPTLDNDPEGIQPFIHQYNEGLDWDSYDINVSWDLYGGGGLATTTRELALFSYNLFNGKIIESDEVFSLLFTEVPDAQGNVGDYYLGISEDEINGYQNYGHSGFWGTDVRYFPELDTSISLFVLNGDHHKTGKIILSTLIERISE